ncbi:pentapeptide repeat-containing protein [Tolypothrix sp. PCC 7910]|uniref:pentapeptide repeat-containing protein n=1 Tax=Tolypothrix sp. PCC 7910 TaxID=2099387 RepID=UPI00353040BD
MAVDVSELLRRYSAGECDFIRVDLAEVKLSHACLVEIDLSGVILARAKLNGTNLHHADLLYTDLCWTFLPHAN